MSHLLINLWCCPRTLSTATMYSFAQREDVLCVDEPLYASYLSHNPRLYRPYRDELLSKHDCDGNAVLTRLYSGTDALKAGKRVTVCKHIVKQATFVDRSLLLGVDAPPNTTVRHVFLFRDPLDVILAWDARAAVHREGCTLEATCFPQLFSLFSEVRQMAASSPTSAGPIAVDSSSLQQNPREVLMELCAQLGLPFSESQLNWEAGPKDCDGLWAEHWYSSVHRSTGFASDANALKEPGEGETRSKFPCLKLDQADVYRDCLPFYQQLRRYALGVDALNPGSSIACSILKKKESLPDPRNSSLFAWVGDRVLPRDLAKISVFDSAVQGGDAVWEGLRVYQGRIFKLDEHLSRLQDSAKALLFSNVPSEEYIRIAIFKTLAINGMRDAAHIRLTLTRGPKLTSSMNPVFNVFGCTLIVLPEWKPVCGATTYDNTQGVTLITAAGRRNSPQCLDSKIHHCNLLNNILPKMQANLSGAADALMLDTDGFISETNATNVFIVKNGVLATPEPTSCLPGITRATVISLAATLGIACEERRISLAEAHTCDEFFTTGTMGELTPVVMLDGRPIGREGTIGAGPVTLRIQEAYSLLTRTEGAPLPF